MAWFLETPWRDKHRRPKTTPAEREREQRWKAQGAARVVHPIRGTVVVPCSSKFAALLCAAEVWGCNWADLGDAEVWRAEPGDRVASMPTLLKRSGGNADQ